MSPLPPESPASMIPSPDNMPGDFTQRPTWTVVGNIGSLAVFLVVCAIAVPTIFLYPYFFGNPSSQDHFLVHLPLPDFFTLDLLDGPQETQIPEDLNDKAVLLFLWGPWDDDSCRVASMLAPVLEDMKAAENLVVIPVACFAATLTSEQINTLSHPEEFKADIINLGKQREPMRLSVERAYNTHGFSFPAVWWNPINNLRTDLLQMGLESQEVDRDRIDGIGLPTVILAQHGLITHVWTKNAVQNFSEIRQQLMVATNFIPALNVDALPAEPVAQPAEPAPRPAETLEERASRNP